jgi:hypothetical protein
MSAYYLIPTISFEGAEGIGCSRAWSERRKCDMVKDVGTSRSCAGLCVQESPSPFAVELPPSSMYWLRLVGDRET